MKVFALSDIHGHLHEFEYALTLIDLSGNNMLIICGDCIHGPDSYGVLDRIMGLQQEYGQDKVVALLGNHCEMALSGLWPINGGAYDDKDDKYLDWMLNLPRYYVVENTIFVHAGIDEEAGDMWEWGTAEEIFTMKYPAQTGQIDGLDMKVVAGHVSTAEISGDSYFHDIYYDGASHYYIDGSVYKSGEIPVLMLDTESDTYYSVTENGQWLVQPYGEEY